MRFVSASVASLRFLRDATVSRETRRCVLGTSAIPQECYRDDEDSQRTLSLFFLAAKTETVSASGHVCGVTPVFVTVCLFRWFAPL